MSPSYVFPKGCPPVQSEYNALQGGTYAQEMLWRGWIPIVGPLLQMGVHPPPTCKDQNKALQDQMQNLIAANEIQMTNNALNLWQTMNDVLDNMQLLGVTLSDAMTAPIQYKLLYLFAGTTALTLLCLAILLNI